MGPKRLYLLDEPTTGLDSSTAHRLVSSIREFVHKDKVQPSLTACTSIAGLRTDWACLVTGTLSNMLSALHCVETDGSFLAATRCRSHTSAESQSMGSQWWALCRDTITSCNC